MAKLSIIIVAFNEWPQIIYTLRSVYEEFRDRADFEIIYVDNFPDKLDEWNKGKVIDQSYEVMKEAVQCQFLKNFKMIEYRDHLSHWAAKTKAVESLKSDFFLFLDAHVVPGRDSLFNQYEYYKQHHEKLNGTLHIPITYKIIENHLLQYRMINELNKGWLGYTFTTYHHFNKPYKVSCHSTCGCMMSRKVYDKFGGWPSMMEAWGGGENLLNFVLPVIGMNKWLIPGQPLYHDGAPRKYTYNWKGLLKNRLIAMYMIGGEKLANLYAVNQKGDQKEISEIVKSVILNTEVLAQRKLIESQQVIDIQSWANQWKDNW